MEMSLICKTMVKQEKLTSIWKIVHQDWFWNRGKNNSEMACYILFSEQTSKN